ncbi:MAG: DUF1549 domain-containing protein [Planctomycetaceae bacterium]
MTAHASPVAYDPHRAGQICGKRTLSADLCDDPDIAMPLRNSAKQPNDCAKELIRRWIDQGGEWETHWAYAAVVKHVPPEIAGQNNPIDQFIRSPLAENGIGWASEARRVTLIRRIYFDLIGLPPSWQQVQSFVNDGSPNAWEKVVDELLQSHFGSLAVTGWTWFASPTATATTRMNLENSPPTATM